MVLKPVFENGSARELRADAMTASCQVTTTYEYKLCAMIAPDGKLPSDHQPDHNQRVPPCSTCQGALETTERAAGRATADLDSPVRVGLNTCGSGEETDSESNKETE